MKLIVLCAALAAMVTARPARANVACNNNAGLAPRAGTVLPTHARLLAFDDRGDGYEPKYAAKLAGKQVAIKVTDVSSKPYTLELIEIDSDQTGELVVSRVWDGDAPQEVARYTVKAGVKLPADVTGATRRFTRGIQHSTVREKFDTLAIDIGDATPAVLATVKIRRDSQAAWSTIGIPVTPGDWMDKHTTIRLGALGCTSNYSVGLLQAGVDLEVTVMLVDGSTRKVKLPAHVAMP